MSTSVKRIESTMRGAPTLNGTAGTLLAVLEALFVTGWGPTTALSVNVAGGVATATLTPGETFDRDSVVLVAGATPAGLNGEARVLTSSNTSITWATTAPDGAATGTITIKYAPQTSWSKVYAATNKAVYRSTHVQSSGHYLRIDDTGTTTARVRGYESMTDVDSGVGPFPTEGQMSGGGHWWKSTVASAAPVQYKIVCDERAVVLLVSPATSQGSTYTVVDARGFGDPISLSQSGDAFGTFLCASGSQGQYNIYGTLSGGASGSGSYGCIYFPKTFSGLGGSVSADARPDAGTKTGYSGSDDAMGAAPSAVDGRIKLSRLSMYEQALGQAAPPRCVVPGVAYIPQTGLASLLADGDLLDGAGGFAGRKLMAHGTASGGYTASRSGVFLIDITGPWR